MKLLSFHESFKATYHIVCTRLKEQITPKQQNKMYRDQISGETFRLDCQHEIEYEYDFRVCVSSILALVEKVARI